NLTLRIAARGNSGGGTQYFLRSPDNSWSPLVDVTFEDALTTKIWPLFGPDNTVVYGVDSRGRDKSALCQFALRDGKSTVLAVSELADIERVSYNSVTHTPDCYRISNPVPRWLPLNKECSTVLDAIQQAVNGGVIIDIVS